MNAAAYKSEREKRGTQAEVAAELGVSRVTIARRETGSRPVIREAWLALLALPKNQARRPAAQRCGSASADTNATIGTKTPIGASLQPLVRRPVKRPPTRVRRKWRALVIARDSIVTNGVRRAYCMWCKKEVGGGERELTIEHIKPLVAGGKYELSNLGIACAQCNVGRMWKYKSVMKKSQ